MQLFVRDKKFYKTLIGIGLPITLQSLITTGVNMADNIMVGRLGEIQMSGVTLANNFITIYQICVMKYIMARRMLC